MKINREKTFLLRFKLVDFKSNVNLTRKFDFTALKLEIKLLFGAI